jgi:capsular polysaccharide transport system permease protein
MSETKQMARSAAEPMVHKVSGEVIDHPAATGGYAARRARPRLRHMVVAASFALAVVLPGVAATTYFYAVAADQYASATAFSVRSSESMAPVGLLGSIMQPASMAGTDAEIVYEFVRSQRMVEAAMAALPIETIFGRPERDILFRLAPGEPVEDIVAYWNWMTNISFDSSTGLVRFSVRAFAPEDAQAIAEMVLHESTRIVNTLSQQAQSDAIAVASRVVAEAEDRLRAARSAIRVFRNAQREVDPVANAEALSGLVAGLAVELARQRIELDSQLALVGESSPRVAVLRQGIASLEKQIETERSRFGGDAAAAEADRQVSELLYEYEELTTDLEFAQNTYLAALKSYEQAQIDARRQSRFVVPHIAPTISTSAQYPQRALLSLAVFGLLTVAWSIGVLVVYNVRDRR